jgi:ABC-2 type transport system ATP-binding protein
VSVVEPDVAIATRGLTKRYGGKTALVDLDLSLPAGSVTALVGHNGAGKTTLLRLLAGLANPTSGEVLRTGSGAVAYVSQDKPLYSRWKVADMLEFGARMNTAWDDVAAHEWLASLDVPLDRVCGRLSGGQRAQVSLGLALAARPGVLLLDEPMATLDPLARADLTRALLAVVAETAVTVLLSTHQTSDLHGLADRLLVLVDGRCTLTGEVDDLMAAHAVIEGPGSALPVPDEAVVARESDAARSRATVRRAALPQHLHPAWSVAPLSLEQLVLDHLSAGREASAA